MKANPHNTGIALVLAGFAAIPLNVSSAFAEKDRVATTEPPKSGDQAIAEWLAKPIYHPLPGQMPVGIETVSRVSAVLTGLANSVEPGDQGQGSPWFARLQTLTTGFNQLVASRLQSKRHRAERTFSSTQMENAQTPLWAGPPVASAFRLIRGATKCSKQ